MANDSLLADLVDKSRGTGWAVGQMRWPPGFWTVEQSIDAQALKLGLVAATPNRRGESAVSALHPTREHEAHPASLSAQVGLGEQPLHTDGAHHRRPPDYVILWCTDTSATPTRVWGPRIALRAPYTNGIFVVRSGGETWLAPALEGGRLRFDPGCMTPADASARDLATVLQTPPTEEVASVVWDSPGKLLLLRNRRVLHGRAAMTDGDLDRTIFRVAYLEGPR